MDARITALADILRLNTKLFRNCLDGVSDEKARERLSGKTSSMLFVAAHLADARFYLLRLLGADKPSPLSAYLANARNIDDLTDSPPLSEILSAWSDAGHALRDRLDSLAAEDLDAAVDDRSPMSGQSTLAALAFLVQHESYHIGQLALLRKHAGFPAMSYE